MEVIRRQQTAILKGHDTVKNLRDSAK